MMWNIRGHLLSKEKQMKEKIINNLKDDKGISQDELIYLIDNMVWIPGHEEMGMSRFEITKWLMQNQYKTKNTLWIIEELMKEIPWIRDAIQDKIYEEGIEAKRI